MVSWMTHNENLMVFITVQNLVATAIVVLLIQKFEYFAHLAFFWLFWGKNRGKSKVSEILFP